jgi:hypothetical protein
MTPKVVHDNWSNWPSMILSIPQALSMSLLGIPMFGVDTCGSPPQWAAYDPEPANVERPRMKGRASGEIAERALYPTGPV